MTTAFHVPDLGESISEVRIGAWLKQPGDWVDLDELLVEVESDKATVQMPSPASGVLTEIKIQEGVDAKVGDVLGMLDTDAERPAAHAEPAGETAPQEPDAAPTTPREAPASSATKPSTPAAPAAEAPAAHTGGRATPSARRLLREHGIDPEAAHRQLGERIDHEDAARLIRGEIGGSRQTERVRMSPLRRTIAKRLVAAQSEAALLTTFNEIDMTRVMDMRKRRGEQFLAKHGVKLGFMSFFVKAVVEALKAWPGVNAQVEGEEIIYHRYCDVGVAVSTDRGLVVPVLRNAEQMGFAEIELAISDFGARAREGRLEIEELTGGTFTVSNGGIYGSLLSTPIVSPPQSGVLGMHAIQKRPVAVGEEIALRPMMYVALSYDHRVVDGREAVSFLKQVKQLVEDPADLLLEF